MSFWPCWHCWHCWHCWGGICTFIIRFWYYLKRRMHDSTQSRSSIYGSFSISAKGGIDVNGKLEEHFTKGPNWFSFFSYPVYFYLVCWAVMQRWYFISSLHFSRAVMFLINVSVLCTFVPFGEFWRNKMNNKSFANSSQVEPRNKKGTMKSLQPSDTFYMKFAENLVFAVITQFGADNRPTFLPRLK